MTDDASLPPEVRRIPADPARALDAALAGVDSSQMKEGEGGEEFDVAPVPANAQEGALRAIAEPMPMGMFAPEPVTVTKALQRVQAAQRGTVKRINVKNVLLSDAVVRLRAARGERYRRELLNEVLKIDSSIERSKTFLMQTNRYELELASVRGDDIGAVVKAQAEIKESVTPDDPLSQEIFLRHKKRGPSGKSKEGLHSIEAKERLRQEEDESDDAEGGE